MATGTIPQLYNQLSVENVDLSLQEFYCLVKIIEQIGQARIVGVQDCKHAGRKAKIYQIDNFDLKMRFFEKNTWQTPKRVLN